MNQKVNAEPGSVAFHPIELNPLNASVAII